MLVVVTRLQAKDVRSTAEVGRRTGEVLEQLRVQPGFLGGRLLIDRRQAAWTVTGWADRASLAAFREVHAPVAGRIDEVASGSATTAWVADALPSWAEVARRWTTVPKPGLGLRASIAPAGLAPVG